VIGKAADGLGKGRDLFVTVALGGSLLSGFVSYDVLAVSAALGRANAPSSGSTFVTAAGRGFGLRDSCAGLRLSASTASAIQWRSTSCVVSRAGSGVSRALSLVFALLLYPF
jgi:hypothetical protein